MSDKPHLTRAFLSPTENIAVGILGGCIETTIHMPLLTWKFSIQEGRPLPKNVKGFYRGLFAQAGSVAPITAVQVVANGIFEKIVSGGVRDLTNVEKIGTSIAAGAVSSIVYSPADLVTIHQQKLKKGPIPTVKHILSNYGLKGWFRGISACAAREAIYTCGYLGLTPVLTDTFKGMGLFESTFVATLAASTCSGLVSSVLSHPIDTSKTVIQADITASKYVNARTALPQLYQTNGLRSLYKGGLPRCMRVVGAFFRGCLSKGAGDRLQI